MSYATPQSLLRFGAEKLAQLCTAMLGAVMDAQLLADAINEEDLSGYTGDEQALAAKALVWIEERIAAAALKIDSYISAKYSLPLTQLQIDSTALPVFAEDITYHQMMINGPDEITESRYKEAMSWLRDVSRGLAKIGGTAETEAAASDQRRLSCAAPSAIDWGSY
jgi:phage gp36-like protein